MKLGTVNCTNQRRMILNGKFSITYICVEKKFVCEYMINKFVCEYMIKKEKMTM